MDVANHVNDVIGAIVVSIFALLGMILPAGVIDAILLLISIVLLGLILWYWFGVLFGKKY
jgi:hypothetical protein